MAACDVTPNPPVPGTSGPSIPGFGIPSAFPSPNISPYIPGFPENLVDLLNELKLLIPPGALNAPLNPNFGKNAYDAIMKLLDQFMPYLMLYKFILPILNIILCIIEVICSIPNPIKLIASITRLFTVCIPAFLALFPIFAFIIMIISLLLLLIALIEFIVQQILVFVETILNNVLALESAFQDANDNSVLAITNKLGALLCIFQNLFVLITVFASIFQIIKDILGQAFSIPPCDDSNTGDTQCCDAPVCPNFVKEPYTRNTGTFQYLPDVGSVTTIVLPPPINFFTFSLRAESWQLYDSQQNIAQAFSNIIDGYDVIPDILNYTPPYFKPVFFPTIASINAKTPPNQAPYKVDLRLFYNPLAWGRTGTPRYIRFKNCIMLSATTLDLNIFDNSTINIPTGVISLGGGIGYEDDGTARMTGFAADGVTPIKDLATLENFVHMPANNVSSPIFLPTDGYTFSDITYTFTPNIAPLIASNLITLGCAPEVALSKNFINTVYAGDVGLKTNMLNDLLNGPNFPNLTDTENCLSAALAALRSNLTAEGVAEFQAMTTVCLNDLKDKTNTSVGQMITIGVDPCASTFTATPTIQFTSKPIVVSVDLKERNGISITTGITADVATDISSRLKAYTTFGEIDQFIFDGTHLFNANLTSKDPGSGSIMISFDDNTLCTNVNSPPSHTLQQIDYQFVYTPVAGVPTAEGDSDGEPNGSNT